MRAINEPKAPSGAREAWSDYTEPVLIRRKPFECEKLRLVT